MIRKIKEHLGNRQLNTILSEQVRRKAFLNYENMRNIGIVFEATDPDEFELVKKYVCSLREQNKKVHAIGFFDQKFTPPDISYPKTEFDLFNTKELKGLNQAASPYIQTFITEIRDVLIDLNIRNKFPLRYIAGTSQARCKIGIDIPENKNLHDVFISISPKEGIEKYLKQVDKYMGMINSR
ncbi:MAG: DUF6913 domain-containing protein [Bacteroidia bacterium]